MRNLITILLLLFSLGLSGQQNLLLKGAIAASETVTDPSDLSGLQLWLDILDTSSHVTADSVITAITDKSPNAYSGNITGSPYLKSGIFNDSIGLYFNGTNMSLDFGTNADWKFLHSGDATIFMVVEVSPSSSNPASLEFVIQDFSLASTQTGFSFGLEDRGGVANNAMHIQASRAINGNLFLFIRDDEDFTPDSTHLIFIQIDSDNSDVSARALYEIEDNVQDEFNAQTGNPNTGNSQVNLHLFENGFGTGWGEAYLYELIITNDVLTATAKQAIYNYLESKHGF